MMESRPIDQKHPLMLAYYIVQMHSSNSAKAILVDNNFIHCAVHQLRCLEIFYLILRSVFQNVQYDQ